MIFALGEYQVEFGGCPLGKARELPELHTHILDFRNGSGGTSVNSFRDLIVVIELSEVGHGIKTLMNESGVLPEELLLHRCDLVLQDLHDAKKRAKFSLARMIGYERDFGRVLFNFAGTLEDE